MTPKATGIEESEASFRKTKKNTIKKMVLGTYEGNEINEKVAYILLQIAKKLDQHCERLYNLEDATHKKPDKPTEKEAPAPTEEKRD